MRAARPAALGISRQLTARTCARLQRWAPYACRYGCDDVRLEIRAEGTRALSGAFASETDLGTGLQRPLALGAESNESSVMIRYEDCPPRTLIRVYWPLESG